MYENECKAKENEMKTRDKIELQHINSVGKAISCSCLSEKYHSTINSIF